MPDMRRRGHYGDASFQELAAFGGGLERITLGLLDAALFGKLLLVADESWKTYEAVKSARF